MHNLILIEPCRYDLFAVRVRVAVFAESGMAYRLRELWEAAPGEDSGTAGHTYRGPGLTLLGGPEGAAWPQLLVLTAPGILEVSCWTSSNAVTEVCFMSVILSCPRCLPVHRAVAGRRLHGRSLLPYCHSQGRPVLLPGDTLYLRSEAHPDVEFGARLLAADGTTCLLVPPSTFWQRLEASGRVG